MTVTQGTQSAGGRLHTSEHEDLRRSLRSFLVQASSESEVRRLMETEAGLDDSLWRRLTGEFGVTALLIPEGLGGAGYGFVEVGLVLEEAGRALLVAPLLSTVLATAALVRSGDGQSQQAALPRIAAGEVRATVALPSAGSEPTVTADADGQLSGRVSFVLDGHTADLLVVAATSPEGLAFYCVDGAAAGVTTTPLQTVDLTRKLAELQFERTPATRLGTDAESLLAYVRNVAAVALAAEQVGGAQRVLEMTVEYAKVRNQFGRPIGSFQAVKHRCADMLVDVESAKSACYYALRSLSQDAADLSLAASVAKAFCSDAFLSCAGECIQLHGGIGFTWEHPAHLYFKRAKASQLLFGDPGHHRQQLADELGL